MRDILKARHFQVTKTVVTHANRTKSATKVHEIEHIPQVLQSPALALDSSNVQVVKGGFLATCNDVYLTKLPANKS